MAKNKSLYLTWAPIGTGLDRHQDTKTDTKTELP